MNRVILSQIEQLKCNFCTQWFSVPSQFACLQKYSLNACNTCFSNFNYRLVNPATFQIYDVVLIKTGIKLTNKQFQLTKKFEAFLRMHRESLNLSQQSSTMLNEQDSRISDLKAEINMHLQPIKQRVSQTCRKFIDGLLEKWNQVLEEMEKDDTPFNQQKQKVIKVLSDKCYNFSKDPEQILSKQRIQYENSRLTQILLRVKKITSQKMMSKITSFAKAYFGNEQIGNSSVNKQNVQNKQNKTPNQKRHLRNIRQKLMKDSRRYQSNQLKVESGNELKANCTSMKSSKKDFNKSYQKSLANKSSQKNLLKPQFQPLVFRKDASEKNLKINTPRSYRVQCETFQIEKNTFGLDEHREKMSMLIKQANQFQTYMPIQVPKNEAILDRTYGQKCMIEYLVQLKMRTTLNNNICQLINQNLSKGNIACYLRSLQWRNSITMLRFVKVRLHDSQFDTFLNWLHDKNSVQIVVLTNNFLTELSVEAIHAFCLRHQNVGIRQIYLGNNYIKPSKVKKVVQQLRAINIQVYV